MNDNQPVKKRPDYRLSRLILSIYPAPRREGGHAHVWIVSKPHGETGFYVPVLHGWSYRGEESAQEDATLTAARAGYLRPGECLSPGTGADLFWKGLGMPYAPEPPEKGALVPPPRWCAVLGLPLEASRDEMRAAFRRKMLRIAPGRSTALSEYLELVEAYIHARTCYAEEG